MRGLVAVILALSAASAQAPDAGAPHFLAADVHVSPMSNNQFARGPSVGGIRYDIHHATMVDLIVRAYGVTAEKVFGGPNWLEYDRFDISALMPPKTSAADAKLMLQALLADRFQLVVHNEERPLPSYVLTAPKGKGKMKESEGSGDGCKFALDQPPPPPAPNSGQPFTPPTPSITYTCRGVTMAVFAQGVQNIPLAQQYIGTNPVQDKTGLEGTWDFSFKYTLPMLGGAGGDTTTLQSAIEKQVGLKLEEVTTSRPVIVVEKVNRVPSSNEPDVAKKIPPLPTEFEVATIKPFTPGPGPRIMMRMMPGGRFESSGIPLKLLMTQAWGLQSEQIVGAPKWMDTDSYDIVAKIPSQDGNAAPDTDAVNLMIQALLADRFKLATHFEDRPMTAYTLTAPKAKLKKADPASRIKWSNENPLGLVFAGGRVPSRTVKFQNMTMAQFAESLQYVGGTYIHAPVTDTTGLEGSYDFSLTFSVISPAQLATIARGPGAAAALGPPGGPGGGDVNAAEPVSSTSIFEAVEKQLGLKLVEEKRPVQVLVIDHIEQKPTEN
jgi:uncharacterized protein (TIGR03435 family)